MFGAEVNAAAKLGEDVAGPEEIIVSEAARRAVETLRPPIAGIAFRPLETTPPGVGEAHRLIFDLSFVHASAVSGPGRPPDPAQAS